MKITTKGQVTIPQSMRESLGLVPGTEVDFVQDGDGVRIVKSDEPWVRAGLSKADWALQQLSGARGGLLAEMTPESFIAHLRDD